MKKKNGVFLGLLIAALLLLTMACPTANNPTPTAVTFESAVQTGGTDGTDNSTGLTLTFSVDPTTLTADDITLTGATKGALSGTGTTRTLAISDITVANAETVSVAIANPSGYTINGSPQTAVVYKYRVRVTYNAGTGNTSGTVPEDTTAYDVGNTVTVLGDPGDLKGEVIYGTTHMQLLGWNTQANGEGTMYYDGYTFTITEDTTLYAIYTALRVEGPAGGLIFYDAGSAQSWGRYLEVAPLSTEGTSIEWGDKGTEIGGNAALTGIGDGQVATTAIVAHMEGKSITDTAAQLCDALSEGEYSDWYLPSKDELNAIWTNLVDDGCGSNSGVGGFAVNGYWSSSEGNSIDAWVQDFGCDSQSSDNKIINYRVRAVRAF